ncbi:HlyC/CorC family transporter [archaeon]|jgi:putative hemolysin|nr:HlyC/CorC family transporter [archaeon]MBT3577639.1 HlyC/CorC family transporter [archaeon]MBT6819895.1 HlyC/CorC family transporter [archaeon]MBT6956695.1 HlyC/CorC family transporter [archaeon]MBT7025051.1 HlyC/CorC family transporter [archaeon]
MVGTQIAILVVLIILSAVFSGIETALVSINMIKVRALVKQKRRGSETLFRLKQNPQKLIITLLIGNNLANIGAASLATVVFMNIFGSSGVGIATGIMTFIVLIFGEITPKTFAAQNSEKISLTVARPIELLSFLFSPFVWFFGIISSAILKLVGSGEEKKLSEEELETIVTMGRKEGILSGEAAEMMHNVLKFEGTRVTEIMTPKSGVHMIEAQEKLKDVLDYIVKTPFSLYPVYSRNKDNIVGIIDVDDVLKYVKNKKLDTKISTIAKKVTFVPKSKEIDDLLTELEGKKIPMVIVVDEYGKVAGIVTVEDILEEIVGDIFDKSRRRSVNIKKVSEKLIRVDARATIEEINKNLQLGLRGEHFETIAGFIEHRLQRVPKRGEKIKLKDVTLEIVKADKQGIQSVNIIRN